MDGITFERQCRTPQSEAYLVHRNDEAIGRIDLHFGTAIVYGTLVLEVDVTEEDVNDLIEQIDEELVLTADVERDDFQVTAYHGKLLGFYSDDYVDEDEDEEEG
jgi:hypothetical protein